MKTDTPTTAQETKPQPQEEIVEEVQVQAPDELLLKKTRAKIQNDAGDSPKRFLEQTIVPEGGE